MIGIDELKSAKGILKPQKAVGIDNIGNAMILCVLDNYPEILLKLFNTILTSSSIIPEWLIGMIVPIHKKGSTSDPENYRGITVMSCLGKFFLSILNNRLLKYTIENNILHKSQLGFMKGNRTSDAHIIINNLIKKYCHTSNAKIYGCFVDFSSAFDTIHRGLLLKKLLSHGIKGKLFNVIRKVYINDEACIKVGDKRTNMFKINIGVS